MDISWPSAEPEGLAEDLWGGSPTIAERQEAAERQLARQFEMRREVIADSITVDAATRILGVSEQAIRASLTRGDLLGIKDGKQWRLPVWQFDADGPRGFLPGIARVADAFHGGAVRLSTWMTCENADLDGRTPAWALASGDVADVVRVAAAATAAAW